MAQPVSVFSAETNNAAAKPHLPPGVKSLLLNADEFALFSLDPEPDFEHKSTNAFVNHAVLGQIKIITMTTRTSLVAALDEGIGGMGNGLALLPDCFNPRHGVRARKNGETVEFLICFECEQIEVYSSKGTNWFFRTTRNPAAVFNRVHRRVGLPNPGRTRRHFGPRSRQDSRKDKNAKALGLRVFSAMKHQYYF